MLTVAKLLILKGQKCTSANPTQSTFTSSLCLVWLSCFCISSVLCWMQKPLGLLQSGARKSRRLEPVMHRQCRVAVQQLHDRRSHQDQSCLDQSSRSHITVISWASHADWPCCIHTV